MSLKNKVINGFAWNILQGVGTQLISFIVFLVLARLLDPESFGLVALATVAVAFFSIFKEFGFGAAIIQREDLKKGHLDTAFWTDILLNLVMMIITLLSAKWIANLYNEPRLELIIQALSLLYISAALNQVQISILRRNMEFKVLAIRTLVAEVIGGGAAIACALSGLGVWSLVVRQLTSAAISIVVLWALSNWRPGFKVSKRYFNDLFGFSINMFAANVVGFFGKKSDTFLIGYFLGPVMLGYYTVAQRLILILIEFLGGSVNKVAWPAFARLQNNPKKIQDGFYSASQLLALIVMPVFLGIYSVAPELVPLIFGSQWEQSIPILKILVFLGIISSINKVYDSIIVSVGRPGIWLSLRTAISISNVISFFVALRWELTGVALAYVIVAYTYLPVYLYTLKKLVGIKFLKYLRMIAVPIIAATLMTYFIFAIKPFIYNISIPSYITISSSIIYLSALITAGIISYTLSIIIISPATFKNLLETASSFMSNRKSS